MNTRQLQEKITHLLKFGLVGIPGALLAALTFIGLTEWGDVAYWHSLIIARALNMMINFLLQKELLFGGPSIQITSTLVVKYIAVSIGLIALNTVLLRALVEYASLYYLIAQVLLIVPMTMLSHRLISRVFKNKRRL